jgi:hypothetical protein
MNLTLLDFQNPNLRIAVQAAARRERARQIVLLAESAFAYLFSRKNNHAARPHLARQG